MIEIDEHFEVDAPPEVVWQVMSDPRAVVGCVPGAALTAEHEDGTYDGTLTVKFGPLAVAFTARIALELHADERRGELTAQGRDKQGGARFRGTASFTVADRPLGDGAAGPAVGSRSLGEGAVGSAVDIHGGVDISGRLAGMIESGATVVVRRMAAEFAERLAVRCATQVG